MVFSLLFLSGRSWWLGCRTCSNIVFSQLSLMFNSWFSVFVLMLLLWLVLINFTCEKSLSASAVLSGRVVAMLNSLQTNGYMFLSHMSSELCSKWSRLAIGLSCVGIVLMSCIKSCHCNCRSTVSIENWVFFVFLLF